MNKDIVIDTCLIGDFLASFFDDKISLRRNFSTSNGLSQELVYRLNQILNAYYETESFYNGVVVTSSFTFIELGRKFKSISEERFSVDQLKAFIDQPPEWFVIDSLDKELYPYFELVPNSVEIEGELKSIEWADAIHVATLFSRGDKSILATSDARLSKIPSIVDRVVL